MRRLNRFRHVIADSPKGRRATDIFHDQYNKVGLNPERAQILNDHPEFAAYLTEGIRRFSVKIPDYTLAQSILGVDFISLEEVVKAYDRVNNGCYYPRTNIVYTYEQITALAETLPSADTLQWYKENDYAVIPAPSLAMDLEDSNLEDCIGNPWYNKVNYSSIYKDKTSPGWLAIKKVPILESMKKATWGEKHKLLSDVERVPNIAEMVWFIATYFRVRRVRLFKECKVYTSSCFLENTKPSHISVGWFEGCLSVNDDWNSNLYRKTGIAPARK